MIVKIRGTHVVGPEATTWDETYSFVQSDEEDGA